MNKPHSATITAEELKSCLGEVKLVDVRQPEEHAEAHIEGCVLIPLGELDDRASKELKKNEAIVVYCAHGMRSLDALMRLKMAGYENVRSLEGGIAAWLS